METKIFEVRDRVTFISVMATKCSSNDELENAHLIKNGFSNSIPLVLVGRLGKGEHTYYPDDWGYNPRTMYVAHKYIEEKFDELNTGEVVDVQFILGETSEKEKSDIKKFF